jgi:hypothetical protein
MLNHPADMRQAFTEFCHTMLKRMLAKDDKTEKRKTTSSVTTLPVVAQITNPLTISIFGS